MKRNNLLLTTSLSQKQKQVNHVTFVAYSPAVVVSSGHVTFKQRLNCALCHLYFTDCADTDEYRGKVRADLVEWFAGLRDCGSWDWIIVIDTSRARESKTRVQLLEKIKSDFSKFLTKIVEVETSGSKMPALTRSVRDQLVASLDSVVVAYEDFLQTEKEKCYSQDWNLFSYVDSQFALSQLYGALGLQDQVLAQYDELSALFSVLIWNVPRKLDSDQRPVWSEAFLAGRAERCPSVLLSAKATSTSAVSLSGGTVSLVELRVLLLARQLVAVLDQYNIRLQSVGGGSIQSQYCALLLSYSDNCLRALFEEAQILQMDLCAAKRHCWICLFCEEVFSLCFKLVDPSQVDSGADHTCHLWIEYCNSLSALGHECGFMSGNSVSPSDSEKVLELMSWLPDTAEVDGIGQSKDGLQPGSKIKHMLNSKQSFQQHFQKTFENSMAVLKHFNWKRHARFQGKMLADFLVMSVPDSAETALPLYLKLLNSLAKEKWEVAYVSLLQETIHYFENVESYKQELTEFFGTLAVKSCVPEMNRRKYAKNFLLLSDGEERKTVEKSVHGWFAVGSILEVSPSQPNPGQDVVCGMKFVNNFPIPIGVKLRICCKQTGRFFSGRPRFRVELHEDGSRLTCSGSHNFLSQRLSEPTPQDCTPGGFASDSVLQPGQNWLLLSTVVNSFNLEMTIPEHYQILFHVRTEQPSAKLLKLEDCLYGGFSQPFKLVANPGSMGTTEKTNVSIYSEDSSLLFRDEECKEWREHITVCLPPVSANSVHSCFLDGLLVLRGLRSDSLVSAKGTIEWMDGLLWPYELLFKPVLYSIPRLNVIEDRVMFQNSVCSSCPCESGAVVVPTRVVLSKEDDSEETIEALNPSLEPIKPNGEYKFVWFLASGGASRYVMRMSYTLSMDGCAEEYTYMDPVAFDTSKAVYELCCQITSRGLLCRAESQCDLVISLRSLHPERRAETLTVGLEANSTQWHLTEKQKSEFRKEKSPLLSPLKLVHSLVVSVKESGLGQVTFGVIPRSVGYLPLPSVVLLRKKEEGVSQSLPLKLYVRTEGRQVHVLAPLPRGKASTQSLKD